MNHKTVLTACGAVLLGVFMLGSVKAIQVDPRHTTYLTVNTPFALPGVALAPGTYIFELADPDMSGSAVRVSSRDRSRIYLTAFTLPIERPAGSRSNSSLVFGEVPQGTTPPVTAWYPEGASTGHQFTYPAGSRQLAGAKGN